MMADFVPGGGVELPEQVVAATDLYEIARFREIAVFRLVGEHLIDIVAEDAVVVGLFAFAALHVLLQGFADLHQDLSAPFVVEHLPISFGGVGSVIVLKIQVAVAAEGAFRPSRRDISGYDKDCRRR